ncbi:MAG: pyruvate dehydrogenase (acetyl-transferring), homodimeric type [Polyangiaceae bacterium]|nr:pyruvate dehydrogenase (acetyl-transferring), homodimeric type [Polyangiaceae bacterium]
MVAHRPKVVDSDPDEIRDWVDSIDAVVTRRGSQRATELLREVFGIAWRRGFAPALPLNTPYVNTIAAEDEPAFPGDEAMEKRIRRIIRWNAMAMVHGANVRHPGIGGHLSTYASSANLYEVGFNHFFRGDDDGQGDQVYFQGHAAPGIYSRAFLEGRLTTEQLERFRRETRRGTGLPSYPHPRLLPEFWQFPTVSMGLGPVGAIYQARFNRYLEARGIKDTRKQRVWCFMGDGESDEPESLGALHLAARERLDNLVFVVNCNLQRLDGPVRGNGKIIQELEAVFRGSGWNVIKVIWGPEWDPLLARDHEGVLRQRMLEVVDGQWQKYATESGAYTRQHFFGADPRLGALVAHLSDDEVQRLRRGGHSYSKLYAAYRWAVEHQGQPTAILAHTVKGWSLGEGFEGSNVTHQKKKMGREELRTFRDLLELPVPDEHLDDAPFYHPGRKSPEVEYLLERRRALGGFLPKRRDHAAVALELPQPGLFDEFLVGSGDGDVSTTMVFARILAKLIRDKSAGKRVVPIVPDEARTFGLDVLFSQVGIYSSRGQVYEPVDKGKLLYYREIKNGQVLEEGITEAGSVASFVAAATSYSTHGQPMIPFYIFYSMFGFQRTGDQLWLAGDQMARGFVLGATAGRTTLHGEGLQHGDGHSHVLAAAVPNVQAYDVAYAYELAVVIEDGLRRMLVEDENVYYYITLQNESYRMPPMPDGARSGILRGIYRFSSAPKRRTHHVQLMGSGSIFNEVRRAERILAERFGVSADLWGVTSYKLLREDALGAERQNRLSPLGPPRVPYLTEALAGVEGPFIAVSDYMKLLPDAVARWIPGRFLPLGTDGFGLSDTREALRRHFEVDAEHIVVAALTALHQEGRLEPEVVATAIRELGLDADQMDPMRV